MEWSDERDQGTDECPSPHETQHSYTSHILSSLSLSLSICLSLSQKYHFIYNGELNPLNHVNVPLTIEKAHDGIALILLHSSPSDKIKCSLITAFLRCWTVQVGL